MIEKEILIYLRKNFEFQKWLINNSINDLKGYSDVKNIIKIRIYLKKFDNYYTTLIELLENEIDRINNCECENCENCKYYSFFSDENNNPVCFCKNKNSKLSNLKKCEEYEEKERYKNYCSGREYKRCLNHL